MSEVAGMSLDDFSNKCKGSIFTIDNCVFLMEEVAYPEMSGEERVMGSELINSRWHNKSYFISELAAADINLSFPQVGYINYRKGAVYLQRNCSRQWKLGYNSRTVSILDRFERERDFINQRADIGRVSNRAQFIRRVFDRSYYSFEELFDLIKHGARLGGAIHPYICITQSINFKEIVICYKNIPVGYILNKNEGVLFSTAEYIKLLLPFPVTIQDEG